MTKTSDEQQFFDMRFLRKDIGVAIVVIASLLGGLVLRQWVETRTHPFSSKDAPFSAAFPARWVESSSLSPTVLVKMIDPATDSEAKTQLTVEARQLDPSNLPTLQTLVDQRAAQRNRLVGYHYLSDRDANVGPLKGKEISYAYVEQPNDTARRASLPVAMQTREVIVMGKDNVYYLTFASPASEFAAAVGAFDQFLQTVKLQ